jgi:hypothetical protein
MTFQQGDRVQTPLGPGTVAYVRMAPPDYREPDAVSVRLDSRADAAPWYTGTIFAAHKVQPWQE